MTVIKKKKSSIIDYVIKEQRSFDELPFNEVDSLVFSWISYLPLNESKRTEINASNPTLSSLLSNKEILAATNRMFNPVKSKSLLEHIAISKRFKEIPVSDIREKEDRKTALQYASYVFHLSEKTLLMAFRGTNATMNGWKEDLDMSFEFPVASQTEGLRQTRDILRKYEGCSLILTGHSKGGNIAVFAGAGLTFEEQKRIVSIHSHDGPGFLGDYTRTVSYQNILPKIHKTIPQSSIFGLLLENTNNYKIIQSNGFFVYQHSPFTWLIDLHKDSFITSPSLSLTAKLFYQTTSYWLKTFPLEDRKKAITMIFDIFLRNNIKTSKELKKSLPTVVKSLAGLSPKDKEFALGILKGYASIGIETLKKGLLPRENKTKKD